MKSECKCTAIQPTVSHEAQSPPLLNSPAALPVGAKAPLIALEAAAHPFLKCLTPSLPSHSYKIEAAR